MPRPPVKRRKQNSFQLKKRKPLPDSNQARLALAEKLSQKPVGKRPQDSDDSDELVVTRANARGRKQRDIYASGGLAKGDEPGGYPTRAQRTRSMREDTEEILSQRSRSRSVSRADSVPSSKSTPEPTTEHGIHHKRNKGAAARESSVKKADASKQKSFVNGVMPTPQAEVSVLGKIKPRKRQASILQLMHDEGANTSSILNSDDEERFLPDAVSTPIIHHSRAGSNFLQRQPSSLKRKRDADGSEIPAHTRLSTSHRTLTATEQLPAPAHTQLREPSVIGPTPAGNDSVMALPESSEDEDEASEISAKRPARKKAPLQRPTAPTTQQLKRLMPSNRHKDLRRRIPRGGLEIPRDSADDSDEDEVEEVEHSIFTPKKSRRTGQRRQTNVKRPVMKEVKTKSRIKGRPKSTKTTSYTPSPVRIRTPLPLSVAKSGNAQAKSPAKQDTTICDKPSSNTAARLSPKAKGGRRQYGGSRTVAAGKENQPMCISSEASDDARHEAAENMARSQAVARPEAQAWSKKWADIDDFELDFEDVSVPTMSSSPGAR